VVREVGLTGSEVDMEEDEEMFKLPGLIENQGVRKTHWPRKWQ